MVDINLNGNYGSGNEVVELNDESCLKKNARNRLLVCNGITFSLIKMHVRYFDMQLMNTTNQNRKQLIFCIVTTFFWGMLAHGYCFMNSSFSHDSLNEFNGTIMGTGLKIMTGRFLSPIYRAIFRTELTIPWLIGLLALLWLGLSVFLIVCIFKIQSKTVMFLIAGVFVSNMTVSATAATFLHDFDCDMLSLLFSIAAVYAWRELSQGSLIGSVCVTMSLGLYQSYITVTIVLIMFACILDILDENSFGFVFLNGIKAVGMLLVGGILYYIAMKATLHFHGIYLLTGQYNTLDKPMEMLTWSPWRFKLMIEETYRMWYSRFTNVISPYPAISSGISRLLLVIMVIILGIGILNRKIHPSAKMLCIILIVLLPLAMNLMYFLTVGNSHWLMVFAFWLTYLLALLLGERLSKFIQYRVSYFFKKESNKLSQISRFICPALVLVLIYGNVQTANAMYLKKDLEQDAYLSVMTRVVYRMEDYDTYVPGLTPVIIVGLPEQMSEVIPGFEPYREPTGMYMSDVINHSERERWQAYFSYLLMNPITLADDAVWNDLRQSPQVQKMPAYPMEGCITMIDGTLVVKLG